MKDRNKYQNGMSVRINFEEYKPASETTPLKEFILEVIERRGELEISQKELAELLGTTQSVISRFENLGRKPAYDFIKRVTEELGGELLITLNGDYTLVVPKKFREKVDKLANKEGFNTKEFLSYLLRESLENWVKWH